MLSREHRFHGHGSLNYVYRKGQTIRSPYCAMKFVTGKYDTYRLAIVVSKKVAKSAPDRNRIRRRIFEAVRLNDKVLKNQDIVVTVFDDRFLLMPHEGLMSSIKRQLEQIAKYA